MVGLETNNFRSVTLTSADIASLKVTEPHPTYNGDGNLLRLRIWSDPANLQQRWRTNFK